MNSPQLEQELKEFIIAVLSLEDLQPADIDTEAPLFGEGLEDKLEEDLKSFKQVMETGMPAAPATS